jgi:hypothetical protein
MKKKLSVNKNPMQSLVNKVESIDGLEITLCGTNIQFQYDVICVDVSTDDFDKALNAISTLVKLGVYSK